MQPCITIRGHIEFMLFLLMSKNEQHDDAEELYKQCVHGNIQSRFLLLHPFKYHIM